MLIVLRLVKHSWATWGVDDTGYGRVSFFARPSFHGRAVLFYPFVFLEKKGKNKMKKILSLVIVALMLFSIVSCDFVENIISPNTVEDSGAWENATYLKDKEFGNGKTTVQVEVKAEGESVTFTIHTDKNILGDALVEHNLIAGEEGQYGLYVKLVNGIEADYDKDQTYWAFYKNGEYMMSGVDTTEISDGEHYELVKEK